MLSVNESLVKQLKTLKMYIEIQKIFVSIIYQKVELFLQNLSQIKLQSQLQNQMTSNIQNSNNQNKDLNNLNNQNNQNNILSKINPSPQIPINPLNNLQKLNPVPPTVPPSNLSLLNSPNINYNSPIIIPSITQLLQNNNLGINLPFLNIPTQQFKQELPKTLPNLFSESQPFPLFPQQQGINTVGNPIIGQNIPKILK